MALGLTTDEFIEAAQLTHGKRYAYNNASYVNYKTPVTVTCDLHGDFTQKPNNHLYGAGCPTCAMIDKTAKLSDDKETFVRKAQVKFGDRYTYERVEFVNSKTPVIVTCVDHGNFIVTPNAFLTGHTTCSTCSGAKLTTPSFVARAQLIHGDKYDYAVSKVAGYHGLVTITCTEHGDFEQTPNNHFQGKGCPKCAGKMMSDTLSFKEAAIAVHDDKYDYSEVEYVLALKKIKISCKKHGVFEQTPANHINGNGCPKCVSKVSKPEIELFEFVKSIASDAVQSVRSVISPFELDIVLHDKKIAIEYNGLYFHSDRNEGRKDCYHYDKMIATNKAGYSLIQVWEDDWKFKRDIVEKTLTHILGAAGKAVFARRCNIVTLGPKETVEFFEANHLQGCSRRGVVYALEYDGAIVAAMIFHAVSSERGAAHSESRWELGRFATTSPVTGGASRLLSAFLKDHPDCREIISYSDNDWFSGKMYQTLGFDKIADVRPDYRVVEGKRRHHKTKYKLSELRKKLGDKFNPLLSERENCRNNGLYRVYNSGLRKWKLSL